MPHYFLAPAEPRARFPNFVFDEKDSDRVERLGSRSLAKRWKPIRATLAPPKKGGDLSVHGAPIVTPKAWSVLEPLLGAHVEALPLATDRGARLVLNVLLLA